MNENETILIIDDDNDFRSLLVRIISKEGFHVLDADNAANALKRQKVCDETIVKNLINAALTYNGRLSGPCSDVLKTFKKDANFNAMIQKYISTLTAEEQERLKKAEIKD